MRWYKITCAGDTWDATGDPNALNVEMDIPISPETIPKGGAFVRVWGIALQTLLGARKYNNQPIQVYGGMQKGLPLANPAEQGLLVQGTVFPALGNWVNTDMTLDFYIKGPFGAPTVHKAANVIHSWPAGQPLSTAVKQTLQTAFPGYTPVVNISPQLVRNFTDTGFYQSIGQWSSYLFRISKSIIKDANYQGVHVTAIGNKILVDDGTSPGGSGQVNFQDLIGQPIWTGVKTVQFKTVMRGDINIGDTVTLPPALATLTAAANPAINPSATNLISGQVKIQQMRHTGNFRQPDWPSWATTFDGIMLGASTPAATSGVPSTGRIAGPV